MRSILSRFHFSSFRDFTTSISKVHNTPSNNEKIRIFRDYIISLSDKEAITLQKLFELVFSRFSKLSDKRMIKNCQIMSVKPEDLEQSLSQKNDFKEAIANLYKNRTKTKIESLTLEDICQQFQIIKNAQGHKAQSKKFDIVNTLLSRCEDAQQRKVLLSLLTDQLTFGLQQKRLLNIFKDLQLDVTKKTGHKYEVMLSKVLNGFDDVEKFVKKQSFAAEFKFDGERAHIQYNRSKGEVEIFSRNGKSKEEFFPQLSNMIKKQLKSIPGIQSCILDGQLICVDGNQKPTDIHVLLNRKSKSVSEMDKQYQQRIKVFDILQLNGKILVDLPYEERIKNIPVFDNKSILNNLERKIFKFPEDIEDFKQYFKRSIEEEYEGLIIKKLSSHYDIKKGRTDWAKLKKGSTEEGTIGRTVDLDLIMIGAYKGRGKRIGVFGSYLFGVMDKGKIYPISKSGSSLTDETFEQVRKIIDEVIVQQVPEQYVIPKNMTIPDVWLKPTIVVQVAAQEWSRSPIYEFRANEKGGLSLRFPRFIRVRTDKNIEDSTQGDEITGK